MNRIVANDARGRRRASVLLYLVLMLVVLIGMVSLGVDLARVQFVKAELATAADAAARNGASYLPNGSTAVQNAAVSAAAANTVDGTSLVLNAGTDVTIGTWNAASKSFTAGGASPNAVRVDAQRTVNRGNPVKLIFGSIIGQGTCDIHASAITVLTAGSTSTFRVDGWMNPYLAGMPVGNYGGAAVSGTAPVNSPKALTAVTLTAGAILTFGVTGSAADDPVNINQNWNPDGEPGGIRTNDSGYLNGMSQLKTQQASLVGVFLDNNAPTVGATPPALDMSTSASMDYTSLSPALKQPFFIGDGKRSTGTLQQIVVPAGATRLFLGMHDNINWANNSGYYMVTVNGAAAKISFAK